MRTINKDKDLIEMRDKISEVVVSGFPVISWQNDTQGKRVIRPVFIKKMIQDDFFLLQTASKENFDFSSKQIFFYVSSHKVIFKTEYTEFEDKFAKIIFPKEMKVIDEDEIADLEENIGLENFQKYVYGHGLGNKNEEFMRIAGDGRANVDEDIMRVKGLGLGNKKESSHMTYHSANTTEKISTKWKMSSMSSRDAEIFNDELSFISLDEEDKLFASKRETVRAKPKTGKMITLKVENSETNDEQYPLYDLSQGGLSFISMDKEEFKKGDIILISAFDSNTLDAPMVAIVRAVRETDETGIQFKIGCQFKTD